MRLSLELRLQNSVENLSKKAQWRALALDMACVAWIDSTAADKLIEAAALCRSRPAAVSPHRHETVWS